MHLMSLSQVSALPCVCRVATCHHTLCMFCLHSRDAGGKNRHVPGNRENMDQYHWECKLSRHHHQAAECRVVRVHSDTLNIIKMFLVPFPRLPTGRYQDSECLVTRLRTRTKCSQLFLAPELWSSAPRPGLDIYTYLHISTDIYTVCRYLHISTQSAAGLALVRRSGRVEW